MAGFVPMTALARVFRWVMPAGNSSNRPRLPRTGITTACGSIERGRLEGHFPRQRGAWDGRSACGSACEPFFRLWIRPGLSDEQRNGVHSAICRIMIDPPRSQAELRRVAVRTALAQYQGAPHGRTKQLERQYRAYLASGWLRERDMETLPEPRSVERVLLHRLARLNEGSSLSWRQLLRIAGPM
jgi:hypothetical protein